MSPVDKLDAKQFNEQLKNAASLLNGLAVGLIVAGILTPVLSEKLPSGWQWFFVVAGAVGMHIASQLLLMYLVLEE